MNRFERRALKEAPGLLQHMCRPSCPLCSGSVFWMGLGQAVDTLGVDQVNEFLNQLAGATVEGDELDFWRCRKCGHSGVLAAPEAG